MGHVTKSVTQKFCGASEACGPAMLVIELGIEGVWKLSIKGSWGPWTGVITWSRSCGTGHGCTGVLPCDLGRVSLCLSFSEVPYWFWEGRVKSSKDG